MAAYRSRPAFVFARASLSTRSLPASALAFVEHALLWGDPTRSVRPRRRDGRAGRRRSGGGQRVGSCRLIEWLGRPVQLVRRPVQSSVEHGDGCEPGGILERRKHAVPGIVLE